jgi:galactokinase
VPGGVRGERPPERAAPHASGALHPAVSSAGGRPADTRARNARVAEAFAAHFGTRPTAIARAPGRVNLIGEHIDYHDLPVLPMALTRSVRVAFRPRSDGRVRVTNGAPGFASRAFDLSGEPETWPAGDWGNYLLAAARAVHGLGAGCGLDALVTSDVPVAAGLSSSSALVVATALALLAASDIDVAPLELATLLARGERMVGTEGGGMDQAVSLGARAGAALRVDFAPLRWRPVPLPGDWRWIVAHSGVRAEKSGAARDGYNQRRSESEAAGRRVAAWMAGKTARRSAGTGERGGRAIETGGGKTTSTGAGEAGGPDDGSAGYGALLAGSPLEELLAAASEALDATLLPRFRHVVTEAGRVDAAEAALLAGDGARCGALLVASHTSLRDDYEVSHPRLDALVDAAVRAGALGARLTGAGFGGCAIALSRSEDVARVCDALTRTLADAGVTDSDHVFVAEPGGGAGCVPA